MELDALVQLGKYGVVGIIMSMLALIGYIVYLLSRAYHQHQEVFGRYLEQETQAKVDLAKRMTELKDAIKDLK